MNNKRLPLTLLLLGTVTAILINLFLLGRLFPIPHGTSDAGIVGAIGVGLILAVMAFVSWLCIRISRRSKSK